MITNRALLVIAATVLFAMGLVMIFNTSSAEVLDHALNKSRYQDFIRQICFALCGIILAAIVSRWGLRNFLRYSPQLLFFAIILLILTFVPGVGREFNGSRRWIGVAGFTVQPSEFVKYIIPAYFIHRIMIYHEEGDLSLRNFVKLMAVIAIPMVLILIEPNNGTVGVIGITLLILFLLTKISFKFWALPLLILTVLGGAAALSLPYVQGRLKVYMHPELDLKGKGHQPHQAKIAAGSGQMFGKGPGNSFQKHSYLPEAQNDYIAAIFAEEFGFAGILLLISLYMLLAYLGFSMASQITDRGGFYFVSAVTFLISFQAFMNLGVVSGLLPSTGLNLPLFSQGGSSLMANIMGIGFLLETPLAPPDLDS